MTQRTEFCFPSLLFVGLVAALGAYTWTAPLPIEPQAVPSTPGPTLQDYRRLAEEGREAFQKNEIETAQRVWSAALEKAEALKLPIAIANMHNNLGLVN